MHLLFVLPEYPPHHGGGIVTFYEALLPELVRQGHTVDVLVGSAFTMGEAPYVLDGVRVTFLEPERFQRYVPRFGQYEALPELQRYLAAAWAMHEQKRGGEGYDIVEVVDWGLLFVPWVVEAQRPVVVQLHGSTGQIDFRDPSAAGTLQGHVTRLLEAGVLRTAPALHTHSTSNQAEWEEATGRPVRYLEPPLLVHPPTGPRPRSDRGLVVGRIQKWKGPTVLAEAMQKLGADAPYVTWVGRDTVFGESGGSMEAYLREGYPMVWGERVKAVGQVPPGRVAELQAEAGFVVVPSLWDVFNLTAVEAMRSGAVVVCSRGAGAADLIKHGENGFAFPAGDADALAGLLREVQTLPPARRREIGVAARATVAERLAPSTVAADKVAAYREVLSSGLNFEATPWISSATQPLAASEEPLSFLDHQPLSDLARYVYRRGIKKLIAR